MIIENVQFETEEKNKIFIYEDFLKLNKKSVDLSKYKHIRAYHACRPIGIESYLINGLKAISRKSAFNDALKRIRAEDITEDDVEKAFNKGWENIDDSDKKVGWQ